jgi:hypothetical protein
MSGPRPFVMPAAAFADHKGSARPGSGTAGLAFNSAHNRQLMNVRLIGWCARSLSAPRNSSVRTEYALVLARTPLKVWRRRDAEKWRGLEI